MKKVANEKPTYESALSELQLIVNDLQSGSCSIDVIAEKVTRAQFLLEFCKEKLRSTQAQLK
jgi:exodeoxyribonuclease VII small subunit